MSMIVVDNVVCPYCRKALNEVQIPFGQTECKCINAKCIEGWHEGEFRLLYFTVVSRDKRGLGKDKGVMWNIRYKTNGDEGAIRFKTKRRDILLKHKDTLLLTFKKRSKGIFKKKWIGEWDGKPISLFNISIDTWWKL